MTPNIDNINGPEDVDNFLAFKMGKLMDNNHLAMQHFRRYLFKIQELKLSSVEIYDEILEGLAIGAKMISDITGDLITQEMGIEFISPKDEDEEDEEDD